MVEYEKEFSTYIVKQIYKLLIRLCNDSSNMPQYNIICNFESSIGIKKYIFKNFQFNNWEKGFLTLKKRDPFIVFTEEEILSSSINVKSKYELAIRNYFENCVFSIFFDTLHKPYESLFFNYIICAYFKTKKTTMQELLKSPDEYKDITNFLSFHNRSIFSGLNCHHEAEFMISRAATEYLYNCYGMDINLITTLSCEAYEGNNNMCSVYIPRIYSGRGKRSNGLTIKLKEKINFNFNEIRRIRKYMEIATEKLNMVLDIDKKIVGYTYDSSNKYEGELVIDGKLNWKFSIGNLELVYSTGVYRINNKNKKEDAKIDLNSILFALPKRQKDSISKIIYKAQEQAHGTTIVFGEKNQIMDETKRLASYNRCIQVSPINLIKKMNTILNITAIDGAILVDFNGKCYAMGAIFDGDMTIKGNMERGARYNSTVNYIERQKEKGRVFLAVIISEDRTVDIYPNTETEDTK